MPDKNSDEWVVASGKHTKQSRAGGEEHLWMAGAEK